MRCSHDGLIRVVFAFVLPAGLLLASGCATFNRDWTTSANQPTPTNSLLGRWEGTWLSEVNGHNGNLRCVVTQKQDGTYRARFHAIYQKVLGFGYTVQLDVTETNGVFQFRGRANLGWWAGGVYHYEGHAQPMHFFSTYRCKYDHGTFQMTRLPQEPPTKPRVLNSALMPKRVVVAGRSRIVHLRNPTIPSSFAACCLMSSSFGPTRLSLTPLTICSRGWSGI